MERNYEFRKRLLTVHKPDLKEENGAWKNTDCIVDENWTIVYPYKCHAAVKNAALDLQEFFHKSMGIAVPVVEKANPVACPKTVALTVGDTGMDDEGSYCVVIDSGISITGNTPWGCAQGVYAIEDQMKLNRGPGINTGRIAKKPLFLPRMIHSGYGLDIYPDDYLRNIAHAGFDTILVFITPKDTIACGERDWNDLIARAGAFGLKVYAYSCLKVWKHPDDEDAWQAYDAVYGELFKNHPGLAGVTLVGESVEFPSKDENVICLPLRQVNPENNPEGKPSPGWYPCYDYNRFVEMVRDVVRSYNKDADVVFWTYNWGYQPEEARVKLIKSLPKDISVQATFEMFEYLDAPEGIVEKCVDYTLIQPTAGKYFLSEAKAAKEAGIKLHSMSNTGGLSWDFGVIPYQPASEEWIKRYNSILECNAKYGLRGLMESHHYGFWPSIISELAKNMFWAPAASAEECLKNIVVREYGEKSADAVLKALSLYSAAERCYVPTEEDQYGPYRVGPSYPLLFLKEYPMPKEKQTWFGNSICFTTYRYDVLNQPGKIDYEIDKAEQLKSYCVQAHEVLATALETAEDKYKDAIRYLMGIGDFMGNTAKTTANVKRWHLLKWKLFEQVPGSTMRPQDSGWDTDMFRGAGEGLQLSADEKIAVYREMEELLKAEIQNVEATRPLVQFDSRLGWEPSMGYMCDEYRLDWKINRSKEALKEAAVYLRKQGIEVE